MKSIINIDVPSFYRSNYKILSWTIAELTDNGTTTSVQEDSVTDKEDIKEAIKDHIDNIIVVIQENGDLVDYEVKLSSNLVEPNSKAQFNEVFHEYYTGDQSI
ncbi:hypothetical protein FAZ15_00830 [Sphingobacterium olei]|uniref:Uncharacterized protein n=1 Tax=Sphingobacterium olei TaxID=2571155 RepID=A0A4U0PJ08_9SPHI|nr:hypothetical protein [Sphingobacterium olei]TJZ62884.1 hypothetical protein FAZ15_00830 [Sphingobacterium olei]